MQLKVYQRNQETNVEFHARRYHFGRKRNNGKKESLLYQRNPRNDNSQKVEKVLREKTYNKKNNQNTFKVKSILSETLKMIDNHD